MTGFVLIFQIIASNFHFYTDVLKYLYIDQSKGICFIKKRNTLCKVIKCKLYPVYYISSYQLSSFSYFQSGTNGFHPNANSTSSSMDLVVFLIVLNTGGYKLPTAKITQKALAERK